ncbi:7939_t:CDS:2 [Cetraspora pellucida]|uniref:7939_t:CDS:1 n=1 Tax=Cetraspora pellucida TaxID=1433469 RepID=A0A9N9C683_9GLOM|nr:7939_t:CDS:2 [Cetraspora pellucida]
MSPLLVSDVLREHEPYNEKVIQMYVKCFDDQDKLFLLDQGIDVSEILNYHLDVHSDTHSNAHSNCSENSAIDGIKEKSFYSNNITTNPPLFNYPGFLRRLNYTSMIKAVEAWCYYLSIEMEKTQSHDLLENAEILIFRSLLKLCLNKGARLHELILCPDQFDPSNDEMYMSLVDDEFKDLFAPIRTLEFSGMVRMDGLLQLLSQRCHGIEHMRVTTLWARRNDDRLVGIFRDSLTSLFAVQNSLTSFELSNCKAYTSAILPVLGLHTSTIRYIRFDNVNFEGCDPLCILSDCKNMDVLEITQCANLSEEMVDPIMKAKFKSGFEVRLVGDEMLQCEKFKDWVNKNSRFNKNKTVGNVGNNCMINLGFFCERNDANISSIDDIEENIVNEKKR